MKRKSKCNRCMDYAKKNHSMHCLSKAYMYQLLREKCTHTEEERKAD